MSLERQYLEGRLKRARDRLAQFDAAASAGSRRLTTGQRTDERAKLESDIDSLERELAQFDDRIKERDEEREAQSRSSRVDQLGSETDFWLRRLGTAAGIVNVAAFSTIAGGFFQNDTPAVVALAVANALDWFFYGLVCASILPPIFVVRYSSWSIKLDKKDDWFASLFMHDLVEVLLMIFASASVICFFIGCDRVIAGVRGLAVH